MYQSVQLLCCWVQFTLVKVCVGGVRAQNELEALLHVWDLIPQPIQVEPVR